MLKNEHKRNLTVGFNASQQVALLNTVSGQNDSLFEDEKPRHNFRMTDMGSNSAAGAVLNNTIQYNTKTFETLNSNDSLLGGMTGALGTSFQSNLTQKMADAMKRHTSLQFKWLK